MRTKWERIISANMDPLELPGRDAPLFKPKPGGFVWVVTGNGEAPTPPPHMDRQDLATRGGRELDLDASDADFLLLHKVVGMAEYTHCIPWSAITDIVFVNPQAG
jgi:hypothetical protein